MPATTEPSPSDRTLYPISVEAYHALGNLGLIDESVELIEGQLYPKMSKSPLHETIVELCRSLLEKALPANCFIAKERPLTLAASEPEPDLAVIRGRVLDYRHSHPTTAELIIEVCINTQSRDRQKASIYATANVPELWIIEPATGSCTVFTQPSATGYLAMQKHVAPAVITSIVLPQFSVVLAELIADTES